MREREKERERESESEREIKRERERERERERSGKFRVDKQQTNMTDYFTLVDSCNKFCNLIG